MQKTRPGTKSVFGNYDICYFGYDKMSAGKNMAVDEVLKERADKEEKFFLRFYDVERPSVILSRHDHHSVIKEGAGDFDFCRRISGGGPIYLDNNTFQYSFTGPLRDGDPVSQDPYALQYIHKGLGSILADVINGVFGEKQDIILGRSSSVRIWNRPIAAHGQSIKPRHSFLYHGVIVVYPWDMEKLGRLLNMTVEDHKEISTLPNIKDIADDGKGRRFYKDELCRSFLKKLPKERLGAISQAEKNIVLNDSELLYEAYYANEEYIYDDNPALSRNSRFCILYNDEPRTEKAEERSATN
jgi:lipoate-protein ligase A